MLLYRLLSGEPPYRIRSDMSAAQIERTICEVVPPPASAALEATERSGEHASARSSTAGRLAAELRGDLDTILARALHKDPARRYRSVAELKEDIERYRDNRPIQARRDSAAYRSGKFLRRHWRGLGATAAVMLALAIGLAAALWQAEEATRQRDRAEAMIGFMQEVLVEADPYRAGADKRIRDVLVEASALLGSRFLGQPLLEASLRQSVGGVQIKLRDLDAGEENLRRAIALADAHLPETHLIRLRAEADLAWAHYERDELDQAIALYRSILERATSQHPKTFRSLVHNDLGVALNRKGDYQEAITQLDTALSLVGTDDKQRAATLVNLGYAFGYLEQLDRAQAYYQEAIATFTAMGEAGQTAELAYALNNFGRIAALQERYPEALELYERSARVRARVFGERSDAVGTQHLNIGRLLLDIGDVMRARSELDLALDILGEHRAQDSFYMQLARGSHARAVTLLDSVDSSAYAQALEDLSEAIAYLRSARMARNTRFMRQFETWLAEAKVRSGFN